MNRLLAPAAMSILLLASCGQRPPDAQLAELAPEAPRQMAYAYRYGFDVPAGALADAQARHVAMCERLGAARCRVSTIRRSAGEGGGQGSVTMSVAASIARQFGERLEAPVEALGGSLRSSDVEAEDLGGQIVDGQARLRSKQMLVDRLNRLLATRNGPVADLVAAEKAVAEAQGELDAARTEVAQATGRVSRSPFSIDYAATRGFIAQTGDAFSSIGEMVTMSVVALIYFVAVGLPWAALAVLVWLGIRALRRRLRARRARRAAVATTPIGATI